MARRLRLAMPCQLAAVAVAVLSLAAGAASQAPVAGLMGCLTYVQPGSPQSKPPKDCCAGVKGALASPATVACLCAAFGQDYGVPINRTRAAGLPAACGEDPAAFSKCNIKVPGTPTEAPAPSSSSGPAAGSPGSSKSAAARSPISAAVIVAAVAAPLLSYYYL